MIYTTNKDHQMGQMLELKPICKSWKQIHRK